MMSRSGVWLDVQLLAALHCGTQWCLPRMQVGSDAVVQFIAQTALDIIENSSKGPLAQQQPSTEALCAREAPMSQSSPRRTQSFSNR